MLVVPKHADALFTASSDPLHMQPESTMPWAHVRALPCAAGTVLLWHASLIHWGSACDEGEAVPRKSVACAYKLPSAGGATGAGGAGGGRSAVPRRVTRAQLAEGLSVHQRLRLVLQALLKYEAWHPSFGGLETSVLGAGTTEGSVNGVRVGS
jgi:hypothetical protein